MLMRRGIRSRVPTPVLVKQCRGNNATSKGEYNRDRKVHCLMAFSADRNYNMEWHDVRPQEEEGTDVYCILVFF